MRVADAVQYSSRWRPPRQ